MIGNAAISIYAIEFKTQECRIFASRSSLWAVTNLFRLPSKISCSCCPSRWLCRYWSEYLYLSESSWATYARRGVVTDSALSWLAASLVPYSFAWWGCVTDAAYPAKALHLGLLLVLCLMGWLTASWRHKIPHVSTSAYVEVSWMYAATFECCWLYSLLI